MASIRIIRMKSKKSQLYLLTAIFLSVLVFLLADLPVEIGAGSREPLKLYENLVSEAPRVINGALYNGRNVSTDLADFTDKFIYYAGTKNINLTLFYVLVYSNSMTISNRMGEEVNITTPEGEKELADGQQISMPSKDRINVELEGVSYPFSINEDLTGIKFIFRTRDVHNNTEVYLYG